MAKPRRELADWETIEREYRAGQLSNAEIARQHKLTPSAITMRAKREGWAKDLTNQVRERVRASLVNDSVNPFNVREAIDTAAARGVEVVRCHRRDIARGRERTERLGQLLDRLSERLETLATDEPNFLGTLNSASNVNESLARTIAKLLPLERKAFNLDELKPDGPNEDSTRGLDDAQRSAAVAALLERSRAKADGQVPGLNP